MDTAQDAPTLSGRVLDGRYKLERVIARGGMATVYLASDMRIDRAVAVKVMHRALADDTELHDGLLRWFRSIVPRTAGVAGREAQTTSRRRTTRRRETTAGASST